ncbi:TetR/AcrR family transcriptional regulator [Amycolatopsis sp. MEPSY49]|uniref:TetR/AcrR family transcriptional regulator n=1 Tax=Amycolatopsis sp. MEPSY49 TaxID=3151600 RepID=UPI003EF73689
MTPNRQRVLDAAIELAGTQGLRALTHARIDERAGLAKGSASNYFRTRQALLEGVATRLAELELPEVDAAFAPATAESLVDALCAQFEYMTREARTRTSARLVLFLEAGHTPALGAVLTRGRAALEAVGVVALARLGARDPQGAAEALAACFEGLVLHRIARRDETDPRPTFELVVRAALG